MGEGTLPNPAVGDKDRVLDAYGKEGVWRSVGVTSSTASSGQEDFSLGCDLTLLHLLNSGLDSMGVWEIDKNTASGAGLMGV